MSNKSSYVQTDEIPGGLRCMCCRGIHTSKVRMRQCYKDHNKIEVGDATLRELEIKPTRSEVEKDQQELEDTMAQAVNDVRYNEAPEMDELTQARCKIINHNLKHYNHDRRERDSDGESFDD